MTDTIVTGITTPQPICIEQVVKILVAAMPRRATVPMEWRGARVVKGGGL
ncbi:hypothetical protein [Bartonella quintana]|nr:hypothetical protein [Bartonella quintana]